MREHNTWSVSLGRWNGVDIRLHMFFFLFVAFSVYLGWREAQDAAASGLASLGAASLLVLFVSVLLHEWGHLMAANRFSVRVEAVVLAPFGGLEPIRIDRDPFAELLIYLAGPGVNLAACVVSGVVLAFSGPGQILGLMNPLNPQGIGEGGVGAGLIHDLPRLIFWINWALLCINLIPAFPFDGGRALRAAIMLKLPTADRRLVGQTVTRFAQLGALCLLVLAWVSRDVHTHGPAPTWFALVLLAIFLFFSARQEEQQLEERIAETDLTKSDFMDLLADFAEFEPEEPLPPPKSLFTRWREQRSEAKEKIRRAQEAADEARVDDVLDRLHKLGMDQLPAADRSLLNRVSERYRRRMHRA